MTKKHLRVSKESLVTHVGFRVVKETPPHERRKPSGRNRKNKRPRNTSARAEKTQLKVELCRHLRKHLRACGENAGSPLRLNWTPETPPRAEKTPLMCLAANISWKHLRARGENVDELENAAAVEETPPRARRKHQDFVSIPLTTLNI